MQYFDITRVMQEAPRYPGTPPLAIHHVSDLAGDGYNESKLTFYSHVGSHADAQTHFLQDGYTIAEMPVERYLGPCRVVTIPANTVIGRAILYGKLDDISRIVLHGGGNSYLNEEAAAYLVQCGVQTVVTDALSVASIDREEPVHRILLESGVAIVENVILDSIPDGDYWLSALPLRIADCDGAPVRAILFRE